MADYAKKKNDELMALCKERGLPHTGKKADLVKRLQDHDATPASTVTAPKPALEDDIDWDDEPATETAKGASNEAATNAIAAGGVGEVANPQAVPNQTPAIDPANTDDLTVAAEPKEANDKIEDSTVAANGANETDKAKTEKDYTSGIADRTLDEEIEKRKARARKFGLPEDSDEIKALERAKRFGTGAVPGFLNTALPEDRKRGRDNDGRGGVSKRGRGRGPRPARREREPRREQRSGAGDNRAPGWMSEKDREAAQRRRAKFAT